MPQPVLGLDRQTAQERAALSFMDSTMNSSNPKQLKEFIKVPWVKRAIAGEEEPYQFPVSEQMPHGGQGSVHTSTTHGESSFTQPDGTYSDSTVVWMYPNIRSQKTKEGKKLVYLGGKKAVDEAFRLKDAFPVKVCPVGDQECIDKGIAEADELSGIFSKALGELHKGDYKK